MRYGSPIRDAAIRALHDLGPLSIADLADALELPINTVRGCVTCARLDHGTRYFRIVDWRRQRDRGGDLIRVYDLGPGKDKRRPKLSTYELRAVQRRYAAKNRIVINDRMRRRRQSSIPRNPFAQLLALAGTAQKGTP